MNFKEIQELIRLVDKSGLAEFKLKEGEFEVSIRTGKYADSKMSKMMNMPQSASMSMPVGSSLQNNIQTPNTSAVESKTIPASPTSEHESNLLEIKSPMVGTFYRSSSPDKPALVKVGDIISPGTAVCIVEAMKLFNEIESDIKGKIVKVCVEDASPIEYEQVLFLIDPS